jgi:tetratricopeptide (TPR) repeat protein
LALSSLSLSAQLASEQDRREAIQHYRNGQEFMSAEQFEKAAAEFQQAIKKDALLTLAHHGLGEAYMALKRYASAVQAFTACREAFRTLYGLQEQDKFQIDRRREEDIRELKDAVRRLQSVPNTQLRISQMEGRIQDLERQRKSNTAGVFQSPPELSLALGSAHFRNGQLEDAEREWKDAAAVKPQMGQAHNNLAALYAMTGRKKEAEEAVRAAERARYPVDPRLKDDIKRLP